MYDEAYNEELVKKIIKLKKKDIKHYQNVRKKMDWILSNPKHRYKYLHYDMKWINRVHIGHFVLVFIIDHVKKLVSFEDYDHHDKIYK
jgi:mRNA-degrading endonuclease RelE of RelBE toxin-antitoxin system